MCISSILLCANILGILVWLGGSHQAQARATWYHRISNLHACQGSCIWNCTTPITSLHTPHHNWNVHHFCQGHKECLAVLWWDPPREDGGQEVQLAPLQWGVHAVRPYQWWNRLIEGQRHDPPLQGSGLIHVCTPPPPWVELPHFPSPSWCVGIQYLWGDWPTSEYTCEWHHQGEALSSPAEGNTICGDHGESRGGHLLACV